MGLKNWTCRLQIVVMGGENGIPREVRDAAIKLLSSLDRREEKIRKEQLLVSSSRLHSCRSPPSGLRGQVPLKSSSFTAALDIDHSPVFSDLCRSVAARA